MATTFDEAVLRLLADTEEIEIETRERPDAPAHRVTIWIVVDGDAAYVRSVHGPRGRWYREATTNPHAVLYASEQRLPVNVEDVRDEATITRVSELFLRKYAP